MRSVIYLINKIYIISNEHINDELTANIAPWYLVNLIAMKS